MAAPRIVAVRSRTPRAKGDTIPTTVRVPLTGRIPKIPATRYKYRDPINLVRPMNLPIPHRRRD
jgi:hypothetical protein